MMVDGIEVDKRELARLDADLRDAPRNVRGNVRKALEVTGRNVRDSWRERAAVSSPEGFVGKYPSSIFYDVEAGITEIAVEVGPELGRPGGSAGFLEEGTVGRAPQHAGRDALEANEDDFYDGLAIAIADAVLGES